MKVYTAVLLHLLIFLYMLLLNALGEGEKSFNYCNLAFTVQWLKQILFCHLQVIA